MKETFCSWREAPWLCYCPLKLGGPLTALSLLCNPALCSGNACACLCSRDGGPGQRGRVWGKRSGRLLSEAGIRETVKETANCDLLWRLFTSMSVRVSATERVRLFVSVRDSDESLQRTATGQLEDRHLYPSYPFTANIPRLQPLSRVERIHLGVRLSWNWTSIINSKVWETFYGETQHATGVSTHLSPLPKLNAFADYCGFHVPAVPSVRPRVLFTPPVLLQEHQRVQSGLVKKLFGCPSGSSIVRPTWWWWQAAHLNDII